ncbi:hypothetical protein CN417_26705 [Bacillus thuringiensis]|nr:hypothetical protein CN417_26705 [Bacillus thuringiensis]
MDNRGIRKACKNTDKFILNECGSSRRKAPFGVFFVHKKISPSYRNDKPFKTIIATILILHYIKVRECSYINKVLNSRWKNGI